MRIGAVAALGLLLVPAAAAQVTISFEPVFQLEGEAEASGARWALLVFAPQDEASAQVWAEDASAVNRTMVRAKVWTAPPVGTGLREHAWLPDERRDLGDFRADLDAAPGRWSSLFVAADDLRVEVTGAAEGRTAVRDQYVDALRHEDVALWSYYQDLRVPAAGPVTTWQASGAFELVARGLRAVEYHEVAVACRQGACPDAAVGHHEAAQGAALDAEARWRHYVGMRSLDGSLVAAGNLHSVAFGGDGMDLLVNGSARLPQARHEARCDCPGLNGTVRVAGRIWLGDMRAADGRVVAGVGGDFTDARLDETALDSRALGAVDATATAVAASALLAAVMRYVVAWILRLRIRDPGDALRHPVRARIMCVVVDAPGLTMRELGREAGVARTTLRHHVSVLERVGSLVRHRIGNTHRLYENHGRYGEADRRAQAAWRDWRLRALDYWLSRQGPAMQRDVLEHASRLSVPSSTARDCLRRLVEAGRVRTWRRDGHRWYAAAV